MSHYSTVYGPVKSWRYGLSLGIDPIGYISTCSFNCVYCQLGEIQQKTRERKLFVTVEQLQQDLFPYQPEFPNLNVVTFSGNGEPTLALNLAELITLTKETINQPIVVLTNGTLLHDRQVRQALNLADQVSVKLDGITADQIHRINRSIEPIIIKDFIENLHQFRQNYSGYLSIQTMILNQWTEAEEDQYIDFIEQINPDEIQLNRPTRPKPLLYQPDGRGNHSPAHERQYPVQQLTCIAVKILEKLAEKIFDRTLITVKYQLS